VEHWSESAVFVSALLPFKSYNTLFSGFDRYLDQLNSETKVKVLRLYPDLAGKLCESGSLSQDSKLEHKIGELDKLSADKKAIINELNERWVQSIELDKLL
jgi:2-oxo-4-hydroxy-4-carboxy-5-ureidoimidazoline decarboxylase